MIYYDYIIVGSGLFGATFAYKAKQVGKRALVIDKRPQLGGNVFCERIEGINVHKYGRTRQTPWTESQRLTKNC